LFKFKYYILGYRAGQRVKLIEQNVPRGFVELQEQFVGQRIANSGNHKEGAHMLTSSELR